MLNDLYRKIVMEHAKYRRNYNRLEGENVRKVHYKNPTCGDVITLYIQIKSEKIEDVSFEGEGCSISMASSSMMTELIKNNHVSNVSLMRQEFEQLIRKGKTANEEIDLGDAMSLQGVHKLRARHNCALMAWQALDKLLSDVSGYRGIER
ncbi:Fe-S cluster assembly sulfur transfer protein SufU [Evansella cellulosilytica]|uniref:SUF system FeS assembly protein, NifU family n=1 Tax=Evansella cellulosilytica (strain ATCC 21833 / DSM 2522 / FERM P-1141 / JCM 9156 / N-4) TaxID=649639 RepID=E6U0R5_EVAC2|nr:SUF system NifU family Fe-S cluster assembly protein [Evansella cellulosilytica]ADU29113.1 SUF system FeS assembly protein, NifU family [Evansella cellulosilytica DSM 2522]